MSGNTTIRKVVVTEFATICTGIGGADINMRKGIYPMQKKAPLTPGYCLVGTVKTNGPDASKFAAGDIVACLTVYDAEADTAYTMVLESANVTGVQRVFIHGICGAVGFALMKLCQLQGAQVYGTASELNHEAVRAQGATPFVYTDKNWIKTIKDLGGADAVFDALGFENWDESFSILTASGVLVGYGGNLPSLNESENRSFVIPL
ncbi:hypothetical protein LZ31DRAFT_596492 [Colletotrichum somersetense]|nr:hypothetical protein LZ31DRAFT_596492 [Colletotrichum somersetense]